MGAAAKAISIALLAGGLAAAAAGAPEPIRLRLERARLDPVLPHEVRLPPLALEPDPRLAAALARLRAETGFMVEIDPLTSRPGRAVGGRVAWIAGAGNALPRPLLAGEERRRALKDRALAFVRAHADLFRLPEEALAYDDPGSVSIEREELDVVRLGLQEDGVPVLGAGLVFVARFGDLVYFGSSHAAPPPEGAGLQGAGPRLEAEAALGRLLERWAIGRDEVIAVEARRPLFWLPGARDGLATRRLVRAVRLRAAEVAAEWEGWVDARSGETVALFPAEVEACPAAPASVRARVRGGIRPARGDDAEVVRPLPNADLGAGAFASPTGSYDFAGAEVESRLEGRHARIVCLACQNPAEERARSGEDGSVDFSDGGGPDSHGNGTSTIASRTAYHHVETAHALATKWLGSSLTFLGTELEVQVNGINACNALWSGFALKFFRSSSDCRNTGEIRDIVAHEWGHALDDFDGNGMLDRALSEGAADQLAVLLDHGSCIAESVFVDPATPGASDACPGMRDLDEKAPGLKHSPAILSLDQNDCLGSVHCLGEVYGQAAWHLEHSLESGASYADGKPVGPALGADRAWETMERLYMLSRPLAESLDPEAAGLSLYDAYLIADEEPGGNRPHARAIDEAFTHHDLAESGPPPGGLACAAPPDPLALVVARGLDPLSGPLATVGFGDVAATGYRVLRRRAGGEWSFWPVGPVVPDDDRPRYQVTDPELENGSTYEYLVLAEGLPGCWSPGAARSTLALDFSELEVKAHAESDPAPGGDGDGILEPGEFFELEVELHETLGLRAAEGVSATLVSLDPLVAVTAAPPVAYGSFPPLGAASPSAPFVLYIDPAHACQGRVPLLLEIASDQGCRLRALRIELPAAACPLEDRSEVRFVGARIADDSLNPACTDGDQALDAGEEALLVVTVENLGKAAASSVDVLLSSPEPEIGFVSGSLVTLAAGLAPGASAEVSFDLLAGDLGCAALVPFTAEVSAPENLAPSVGSLLLATEQDQAAVTLAWGFEDGAQGWSGDGLWALSTARSNPVDGGQSFWSGADVNLCSTLVSPPFRLHPKLPATLSLATWYDLEGRFQAKYWDGVNVYLRRAAGPVLLEPDSGRLYDASLGKLVLCETSTPAWCSDKTGLSWAVSGFDLAPYAGEEVQVEVHYATDNKDTHEGFYLDDVVVTNALTTVCDATSCLPDPACSTPEMSIAASASGCAGDPVTLQASFDYFGQGVFAYEWDFGDGKKAAAAVPDAPVDHVYAAAGTYAARLSATLSSDPLCSRSATAVVSVSAPPLADAGPDADAPATLGTPGFAGLEYSWQPAAGLDDPTLARPMAWPPETTEYCLTVRDPKSGCARGDCTLVRVPPPCGLDLDAVRDLALVRSASDVSAAWSPDAKAVGYSFFRLTDKGKIPAAEAWNTTATLVSSGPATAAVDAGAVPPPPVLSFYQVVARCP